MATVTITIDDAKLSRVTDALKGLYAIPVYPEGHESAGEPEFTDNQWAKEVTRRFIIRSVARWEQKTAISNVVYQEADDLAS